MSSTERRAAHLRVEGGDVVWWWSPSADRVGVAELLSLSHDAHRVMPRRVSEVEEMMLRV
jgi:hypothetical protein